MGSLPLRPGDIGRATTVLLGAVLLALGAFLPWFSADALLVSISRSGIVLGDGVFMLVAAALMILTGVMLFTDARKRLLVSISPAIAGLFTGLTAIQHVQSLNGTLPDMETGAVVKVGSGLWIVIVGAVFLLVVGLMPTPRRSEPQKQPPPAN